MKQALIDLCEKQVIPDPLIRLGMRRLIGTRLSNEQAAYANDNGASRFANGITSGPIAVSTTQANNQHYEVPDAFFSLCLGPRLKYSSALWPDSNAALNLDSLARAENAMLKLTVERAMLEDGQDILELGCGWGSLTLYMAERFPNAAITAVSNSASQRAYIEQQANAKGLGNVTVITANVAELEREARYDRVVSVEMFEHMRNQHALLCKINKWLKPHGKLFVHIFCHKHFGYTFEVNGAADWMAENFFTGGIMPNFDMFDHIDAPLQVAHRWWINGTHYQKTLEAWKVLLDQRSDEAETLFMLHYNEDRAHARRRIQKWRMFFMASAELFGFAGGAEWGVGHYLLGRAG